MMALAAARILAGMVMLAALAGQSLAQVAAPPSAAEAAGVSQPAAATGEAAPGPATPTPADDALAAGSEQTGGAGAVREPVGQDAAAEAPSVPVAPAADRAANETAAEPTPAAQAEAPEEDVGQKGLSISVWGGAYGQALAKAVLAPFRAARDIEYAVVERSAGEKLEPADVAEVDAAELAEGCADGTFAELDPSILQAGEDGRAAQDDFMPGSIARCGVAGLAWSALVAFNTQETKGGQPASLADVFNVQTYPGKRAFVGHPRYIAELALMADGVAPADVYQLLGTDEGVARALAVVARIEDHVIWVKSAREAADAVESGAARMGVVFSGRAFFSAARGAPLGLVWDGQIFAYSYWAIARTAAAPELARAFVSFATAPEQLAAFAAEFPYGPARRSVLATIDRHAATGLALKPFLPTAEGRMDRALASDDIWWRANEERMVRLFAAWQGNREVRAAAAGKPPLPRGNPKR